MNSDLLKLTSLTLSGLLMLASAQAQEPGKPETGQPDASIASSLPPELADPGGVRARLAQHGIKYGVNYIGEVLGVTSGGLKRGAQYDGRLEVFSDVDLSKLIGWNGLTFHANAYQIHGRSITAENLGSLAPVSFIEATPATRLFELWLEQSLADGKVSIRVGQLAADSEFLVSEGGGAFIGGTFGWPTIAAANLPDGGPAYPLAAPGARLKIEASKQVTVLAAIFNGRPSRDCDNDDPQRCNPHGLLFPLGDPPLGMLESQFKYTLGLAGTLKLGGWRHFGRFDDVRLDENRGLLAFTGGTALAHRGNHGLYAIVDQKLYAVSGSETRGVGAFARVVGSPDDRNLVDLYVEGGVTFTGLHDARPDDVLGIGIARTHIATGMRGLDQDRNLAAGIAAPIRDAETVLEISYKAQIVPGWTVQPDVQHFWHPGGGGVSADDDPTSPARPRDATVVGVRTTINY